MHGSGRDFVIFSARDEVRERLFTPKAITTSSPGLTREPRLPSDRDMDEAQPHQVCAAI
jgi:hypothetical protein